MKISQGVIGILFLIFGVISMQAKADWASVDIKDVRAFTDQAQHYMAVENFSNPEGCSVTNTVVLVRDDSNNDN